MTWSEINLIQKIKILSFLEGENGLQIPTILDKTSVLIVDNNPYEQGQIEENLEIFPQKR